MKVGALQCQSVITIMPARSHTLPSPFLSAAAAANNFRRLPDFSNYAHEWGRKRVAQFFENSAVGAWPKGKGGCGVVGELRRCPDHDCGWAVWRQVIVRYHTHTHTHSPDDCFLLSSMTCRDCFVRPWSHVGPSHIQPCWRNHVQKATSAPCHHVEPHPPGETS